MFTKEIFNKKIIGITITMLTLVVFMLSGFEVYSRMPGEGQAHRQVDKFVEALDYNFPEKIYPLLTPELREVIDENKFISNFIHERSYPYLTPLFVYVDSIEFDDDYKSGYVVCSVASRLPGEFMEFTVRYTKMKGYYIDALHPIVDGSYVDLFERL